MLDPELLPPLPVTLEEAHREIQYLRGQVYWARERLANQIVEREKDRRAARGNHQAVVLENAELRNQIKKLRTNND